MLSNLSSLFLEMRKTHKRVRGGAAILRKNSGSRTLGLNEAPVNIQVLPEAMHAEPLMPLHATRLPEAHKSNITAVKLKNPWNYHGYGVKTKKAGGKRYKRKRYTLKQ